MKKKTTYVIFAVAIVIFMVCAVGLIFFVQSHSPSRQFQTQLDLGYKYLEELEYEQAVAAFEAAIEIDPRNAESYVGLVDAYAGLNDADALLDVYNRSKEQLSDSDSDRIKTSVTTVYKEWIDVAISNEDYQSANSLIAHLVLVDEELAHEYTNLIDEANTVFGDNNSDEIENDFYLVQTDVTSTSGESYRIIYDYYEGGYSETFLYNGLESEYRFNAVGDCVYCTMGQDETGLSIFTSEYQYDENGRKLFQNTVQDFYHNGALISQTYTTVSFEYDDGGYTRNNDDGSSSYYLVDENGNNIYVCFFDSNGVNTGISYYTYDSRGNVIVTDSGDYIMYSVNTYSDGVVLSVDNPTP